LGPKLSEEETESIDDHKGQGPFFRLEITAMARKAAAIMTNPSTWIVLRAV
jgi:hypothetical protein